MKELRIIIAQPATMQYAWQVEVFLESTLKLGYNGNYIDVLGAYTDAISQEWLLLQQKYPYVRFFFYPDTMKVKNYQPAIQAHIMAKHFEAHPYLNDEAIFFCDCDFLFTRYFDFSKFQHDDNWYFSDTVSYVGADYIESKGKGLLEGMCSVVGLCACKVRSEKANSGGAQKLMKNVDAAYWTEVEEDAINLYNWLLQEKDNYGDAERNDIQIWTASMWSELWNAWKAKHKVIVPKEFNFCWATDHVDKWDIHAFFHNAGVMNAKGGMFFKGDFMHNHPYGIDFTPDPIRCSSKYFEIVQETGKNTVLNS